MSRFKSIHVQNVIINNGAIFPQEIQRGSKIWEILGKQVLKKNYAKSFNSSHNTTITIPITRSFYQA